MCGVNTKKNIIDQEIYGKAYDIYFPLAEAVCGREVLGDELSHFLTLVEQLIPVYNKQNQTRKQIILQYYER